MQPEQERMRLHPMRAARPIVLFLAAKLVAYTVLGVLLGLLGSVMQLSLMTQAMLQAAIGVFMVGTALRMLNVHPIFRYFALEPPRSVTRYIRRKAKGDASAVTPVFLGALTVLIPCGVTQAMMAVAMGTGSAVAGAVTMFAFTLGTSPVFFAVAYLATRLGSRLEAGFMRFVAVVVLILGLISIDAGATLAGWPYSITNLRLASNAQTLAAEAASASSMPLGGTTSSTGSYQNAAQNAPKAAAAGAPQAAAEGGGSLVLNVVNSGYQPNVLHARPNQAYQLSLVTKNTRSCSWAFVIPSLRIQKNLPQTGTVVVDLPPQKAGSKLYYSCSMGMYSGVIIFDA